jgi:hypothetical protein
MTSMTIGKLRDARITYNLRESHEQVFNSHLGGIRPLVRHDYSSESRVDSHEPELYRISVTAGSYGTESRIGHITID